MKLISTGLLMLFMSSPASVSLADAVTTASTTSIADKNVDRIHKITISKDDPSTVVVTKYGTFKIPREQLPLYICKRLMGGIWDEEKEACVPDPEKNYSEKNYGEETTSRTSSEG